MRTRIIAVVVAALLASTGAIALVIAFQGASHTAIAAGRTTTVLVVVTEIPAGTPGEAAAALVEERQVPAAYVVEGTVDSADDLVGYVADTRLVPGEQVLSERWRSPADLAASGGRVEAPEGSHEVSVALDLQRVAGGAIAPGSRVGIWASAQGTTTLLIDQVLVTTLASTVDPDEVTSTEGTVLVTFAVTAEQAQALIRAAEFGKIWLSRQESR